MTLNRFDLHKLFQRLAAAVVVLVCVYGIGCSSEISPEGTGSAAASSSTQPGESGEGGDDNQMQSSPAEVLVAGSGFSGVPIPPPPQVGDSSTPGHDAQAIARWNVVPYQIIDASFDIGVLAFHRNGIERVEFSLDDGPVVAVTAQSFNARTGVWEYRVAIDPAQLSDGLLEVRAIAYPAGAGIGRVLAGSINSDSSDGIGAINRSEHSLFLTANGGGSS